MVGARGFAADSAVSAYGDGEQGADCEGLVRRYAGSLDEYGGLAHAVDIVVAGAQHSTDLIVWKLADEMRVGVFALTRRPAFGRDFKLRSQTDDAIDSVCRNIAEGF